MNGNIETPQVKIIPASVNDENKNANPERLALENTMFNKPETIAKIGNAHKIGISL